MADLLKEGREMALAAALDNRVDDTWFWGICAIFVRRLDEDRPGWRTWSGAKVPCYEHERPVQPAAGDAPAERGGKHG